MLKQVLMMAAVGVSVMCAATKVTIVGDADYAPYSYIENKEPKGVYVDVLKKVFEQMGEYEVTIKQVPWKRALKEVEQGSAFGVFPPYYHPTKRPWIDPYSEPILEEKTVLFCNKSKIPADKENFPEAYHGLKFGINAGFKIGGEAFWKSVDGGLISVDEVKGTELNLKKLAIGRNHCYINARLPSYVEIKKLKDGGLNVDDIVEVKVIKADKGYLGFAQKAEKFPFKEDFVKKFNDIVTKLKADGTVEKIIAEYSKL